MSPERILMEDQQDNIDTDVANQDDAPEGQVADTEESDSSPEETTTEENERMYAGKFKSADDLEKGYQELERFVGNRKEVEEKARAYDQLSQARRTAPLQIPDINQFTDQYGNVDTMAFNQAMGQYQNALIQTSQETARTSAQEAVDTERAERDFPYLRDDPDAAEAVVSLYQSGKARSLYEAAKRLDKIRSTGVESGVKEGAKKKEKEITSQMRSTTERAGAKTGDNLSQEAYNSMSLEEKKLFLEKHYPQN